MEWLIMGILLGVIYHIQRRDREYLLNEIVKLEHRVLNMENAIAYELKKIKDKL